MKQFSRATDEMDPMKGPITALVVDGESMIRHRLAEILTTQGCAVLTVRDSATALMEIRRRQIDVLFTELLLADGDGISLICAARREWPQCQAVVVAANASVETSIEALRHRVADFVLKPISELKIVAALERALASANRHSVAERGHSSNGRPAVGAMRELHSAHADGGPQGRFGGNLRDWKQRLVREAVDQCHGNKAAAAQALGISRRTLYRILQAAPAESD
jgi:DNA-binding NtrC family response regulator